MMIALGTVSNTAATSATMLAKVNDYLVVGPWLAIIPGLAIVLSVLGFNLIGDGLREALDPKLRARG